MVTLYLNTAIAIIKNATTAATATLANILCESHMCYKHHQKHYPFQVHSQNHRSSLLVSFPALCRGCVCVSHVTFFATDVVIVAAFGCVFYLQVCALLSDRIALKEGKRKCRNNHVNKNESITTKYIATTMLYTMQNILVSARSRSVSLFRSTIIGITWSSSKNDNAKWFGQREHRNPFRSNEKMNMCNGFWLRFTFADWMCMSADSLLPSLSIVLYLFLFFQSKSSKIRSTFYTTISLRALCVVSALSLSLCCTSAHFFFFLLLLFVCKSVRARSSFCCCCSCLPCTCERISCEFHLAMHKTRYPRYKVISCNSNTMCGCAPVYISIPHYDVAF